MLRLPVDSAALASSFPELHHLISTLTNREENEVDARLPLPSNAPLLSQPPPCSWLRPGQEFFGMQNVTHWSPGKGERWKVAVTLHKCDFARGVLCGTMTAKNVPEATTPVVTFFTGEIVDNMNWSFYTSHTDWAALAETDISHWNRFLSFKPMKKDVISLGGRAAGLADCGAVFMRWKEQFFLAGGECRLTIAGFYYVALDRAAGTIEAIYYDPASSPDQRLCLQPGKCEAGYAFPAHELA